MQAKDILAPVGAYLQRRLAEPESRAAVGAAAGAAIAYATGQIGAPAMGVAELGALIAFAVPGPIAKDLTAAIAAAGKKPAA